MGVHLGANQAWHSLGETGGGAGEACLLAYRSERALVGFPPRRPSDNCLKACGLLLGVEAERTSLYFLKIV
eukprot:scaffold85710_cov33-Phaeocystis_antarctica.AAC.2